MTFSLRLLPVFVLAVLAACPLAAFDTPCKVGHGVSVSIPGFQDSIYTNRTEGWTKNRCREIGMKEPLGFETVVSNLTDRPICGKISVSLADANTACGSRPTFVTVDRAPFPFSFFVRDVTGTSPVYVPEARCAALPGGDPRSFAAVTAELEGRGLVSDAKRMELEPEESYEHACRFNRDQSCPVWLGLGRDLRIFRVSEQENEGMWGLVVPVYHSKYRYVERRDGTKRVREIRFEVGPGANCRPRLEKRLEAGALPILHATQYEGSVEYRLTLFASLENSPVAEARVRGSEPLAALSQMDFSMLTEQEKAELTRRIETTDREEEIVLFVRVEAVNTGKVPAYAWFKAPHSNGGCDFKDGLCRENGRVFAAVLLAGRPAKDAEYAVLIPPEGSVEWECRIFHTPVAPERGLTVATNMPLPVCSGTIMPPQVVPVTDAPKPAVVSVADESAKAEGKIPVVRAGILLSGRNDF